MMPASIHAPQDAIHEFMSEGREQAISQVPQGTDIAAAIFSILI